jgi:hypothetical protein
MPAAVVSQGGYGLVKMVQLCLVALLTPPVFAGRGEVVVVSCAIVPSVEKVLYIPENQSITILCRAFKRRNSYNAEKQKC